MTTRCKITLIGVFIFIEEDRAISIPQPSYKTLELLQHPAGRRSVVGRLGRAVDVPAVPQDGRRAIEAASQRACCGAASYPVPPSSPTHQGRPASSARRVRHHRQGFVHSSEETLTENRGNSFQYCKGHPTGITPGF